MNNDIVISKGDYKRALNQIQTYIDFLVRMKNKYTNIINDILQQGIEDKEITMNLQTLSSQVSCQMDLLLEYYGQLQDSYEKLFRYAENADTLSISVPEISFSDTINLIRSLSSLI